jgi:bifunctional non-homologous end joining protein LigD
VSARVLFPSGFTTDDLVETYSQLAPVLLPHLADRPLTLKRFPDDIQGEAFWEKDAPSFTPEWVKTLPVPRKAGGPPIQYISIPDLRTLRWAASLACIEIHGFLHKYPYITSPTLIAFDLDPGERVNIIDCCEVALRVRAWFQQHGLESLVKTSGSKGIQVYVPLNSPTSYDVTQPLARAVAEELERNDPERIISRMARTERAGKIFIDWSQNAEHKTTVSVYSVRAKRAAPFISMPLNWEEVEGALGSRDARQLDFSPEAAIQRVKQRGDVFAEVLSLKQDLPSELLGALKLRRPPKSAAVSVPTEPRRTTYSLPRSSGQGGRKLFVVHSIGNTQELGIERGDSFQLFAMKKIPVHARTSSTVKDNGTAPLSHLTTESEAAGIVWDLGTFEVIEGSFEKGEIAVFLSGRKLNGEWLLKRSHNDWRFTNVSGTLRKEFPTNASALADIAAPQVRSGKHAGR